MILLLAALAGLPAAAVGDQPTDPPGEIIVVTAPGGLMDNDDAQRIRRDEVLRGGAPDLFALLDRRVPGLSLSATEGNASQPTIAYRGFSASPLQGGRQGPAVFVDGARFDQPS